MPHKPNKPKINKHLALLCTALLSLLVLAVAMVHLPMHANAETARILLHSCFPYTDTAPLQTTLTAAAKLLFGFNPTDPTSVFSHQLAGSSVASTPVPTQTPSPPATETANAASPADALPILETSQTVAAVRNTEGENRSIYIDNDTSYGIDIPALLSSPLNLQTASDAPSVLIVHTHTTESYTPEGQAYYTADESTRTQDKAKNVVRVGEEIARTLTAADINVLHDTTINDYPSYNGSYTKTLGIIEWYLEHYPSIQVVLDVHRDAMTKTDGTKLKTTADIGGEKVAQVMLVIGTNEGGLSHENWQENLKLGLHIQDKLTRSYPKFARPLNLRKERFNQHATTGSMILEVGTDGNTLAEACAAGRHFATALAEVLQGR